MFVYSLSHCVDYGMHCTLTFGMNCQTEISVMRVSNVFGLFKSMIISICSDCMHILGSM